MEQKKRGRPKKIIHNTDKNIDNYKIVLTMDNKDFTGEGETIYSALLAIPLDYTQIKIKGTFKIFKGDKSIEKFFYLKPLKRLFANKLNRILWARNFEKMLKDKTAKINAL